MAAPLTLDAVNRMGPGGLRQALGGVFESSPWVAERVGVAGPFASVEQLHAAMTAVVQEAPLQQRLALLRAHPDLAGQAARAGEMSASSVVEQSSAGLDRLSDAEYERFARLNATYVGKFGFPFIIAVRKHDKTGILAAFETRLGNTVEQEVEAALAQVFEITRLRLDGLIRAR